MELCSSCSLSFRISLSFLPGKNEMACCSQVTISPLFLAGSVGPTVETLFCWKERCDGSVILWKGCVILHPESAPSKLKVVTYGS